MRKMSKLNDIFYPEPTKTVKVWKYRSGLKLKLSKIEWNTHISGLADIYYCGYVTIKKGNPLYQLKPMHSDIGFNVHGGITYAQKESKGTWTLGWDSAHGVDYSFHQSFKETVKLAEDILRKSKQITQSKRRNRNVR